MLVFASIGAKWTVLMSRVDARLSRRAGTALESKLRSGCCAPSWRGHDRGRRNSVAATISIAVKTIALRAESAVRMLVMGATARARA